MLALCYACVAFVCLVRYSFNIILLALFYYFVIVLLCCGCVIMT